MHRFLDIVIAMLALLLFSPLLLLGGVMVWVADGRPILFVACRAGRHGVPIRIHKFRSMRVAEEQGSRITSGVDRRIFPVGKLLRRTKIDELPQLVDVLAGRLSIVGPRPEDYSFAEEVFRDGTPYTELLSLRPGLISPGTLFYYTHLETSIPEEDAESHYREYELPVKSAFDLVYVRNRSLFYDIRLIMRAGWVIFGRAIGRGFSKPPPELREASVIARNEFGVEIRSA